MLTILTAAALLSQAPACDSTHARTRGALQEYTMDAGHSISEFSIKFAFSRVKGRFPQAKGTILYDPVKPANSSITVVMDSKSLDTGWPHRDEHLRTSDFFDVEKYPSVTFTSTRLTQSGDGWLAEGDLTMHGVTKRITILFHFSQPPTRSPEARWMVLVVAGSTRIARTDFGITGGSTYNSWFDKARAATMADSVDINLELEAYWADAASQRSPGVLGAANRIATEGVAGQAKRLDSIKAAKPAEFPNYLTGLDLITRTLIGACRLREAVALSTELVRLYPESHRVRLIHGFALAVSGDAAGAQRHYAQAKSLYRPPVTDPNEKFPQDDSDWWYMDQLARTGLEWGYAPQVVPLSRTLAELYPQSARAHTTYGQALAAAGDAKGAETVFQRALAINPVEPRALEWRRR
jgi:polyisoprenoid-binding protein YceI/Flp pilus assembly protein TadD